MDAGSALYNNKSTLKTIGHTYCISSSYILATTNNLTVINMQTLIVRDAWETYANISKLNDLPPNISKPFLVLRWICKWC